MMIYMHDVFQNLSLETSAALPDAPFGETMHLIFTSHGKTFDLEMTLLRNLIAENATFHVYNEAGEYTHYQSPMHIAYAATNMDNGFARITMFSDDNSDVTQC